MRDFKVYQASGYLTNLVTDAADVRKVYEEIRGSLVQFDTPISAPLESLIVDINPVQSGTGDPSPDNVRPITGWTGANITAGGKNYSKLSPSSSLGLTLTDNGDGTVTINGTSTSAGAVTLTDHFIAPKTETVICGWNIVGNSNRRLFLYDLTAGSDTISNIYTTKTGSVYASHEYVLALYVRAGATFNNERIIPFTFYSDEYKKTTISWQTEAGTVYGGTIDAVNGTLTVTDAEIASYNGETLPSTWISDRDVYAVGTTPTIGAQVVYKLSTPTEIQLTPQEINTLLGVNNIWADTGDVSVKYRIH